MEYPLIRLNPKATFEVIYKGLMGVVDCRLLFLGDHARQLARTYQEIVFRFSHASDLDQLFENLKSAPEIQHLYEIRQSNGKVSVLMRDSIFREPGPKDLVQIEIQISIGNHMVTYLLPLNRLAALGNLLPLLLGNNSEPEMEQILREKLHEEDSRWAIEFYAGLKANGFLEPSRNKRNYFSGSARRPRLTFLGHSSLLLQSDRSSVVVDPFLRVNYGLSRNVMDVPRLKIGAICCSHSHWDHCDLVTLLWFDKSTPILIPKVLRPTAFNPPIVPALQALGFTDIREVELWKSIRIEDIEVIPVPFHGEQDEPEIEMDHYTYVLRTGDLTLYGGVDCFRDTFGEMKPVLERVTQEYKPNLAFLPISKMVYSYRDGGANAYCRYLDNTLLNKSFQYTASAQDAAEWMTILGVQSVVPYATFTFSSWNTPIQVSDFAKALRNVGLRKCLYPLRPLDSLEPGDWNRNFLSRLRRSSLLMWFRTGAFASRSDRKMQKYAAYRFARKIATRMLPGPA